VNKKKKEKGEKKKRKMQGTRSRGNTRALELWFLNKQELKKVARPMRQRPLVRKQKEVGRKRKTLLSGQEKSTNGKEKGTPLNHILEEEMNRSRVGTRGTGAGLGGGIDRPSKSETHTTHNQETLFNDIEEENLKCQDRKQAWITSPHVIAVGKTGIARDGKRKQKICGPGRLIKVGQDLGASTKEKKKKGILNKMTLRRTGT